MYQINSRNPRKRHNKLTASRLLRSACHCESSLSLPFEPCKQNNRISVMPVNTLAQPLA
jgi:hypothetical protein